MCTGRVDLAFMLRAFSNGMDGVFIGGCWPGECHYLTQGNYKALFLMNLCRKLMAHIGLDPERLRLEWISASEGMRYAEVMNDFSKTVKNLGPLGVGEGVDEATLKFKLEALTKLVPYIRLVEREKLRVDFKTVEEYTEFFASETFDRIFKDMIISKFETSQILSLLKTNALDTGQITEQLGLPRTDVAEYLNDSVRQGFIDFDPSSNRFATIQY
ncbi:hypothetical protein DSCO28_20170 [Desulfosarcina ovata subsp. sediminis]|uniref:F420-non-reducing hydrogenase iron-sulfur subunit D domain-containing protein n=3 Tax=Desulfosarcina ovata TaxID=83564 RepID=A0A5K8A7V7_9BACT|nr:hypothetical protein DSCO28_20170 [Desulfosarcina ovata subsp. sediminis]BBO88712.1 hypothetical protein DSCOOX_18920 [Desulfosarcina ovata subsp. ovata]